MDDSSEVVPGGRSASWGPNSGSSAIYGSAGPLGAAAASGAGIFGLLQVETLDNALKVAAWSFAVAVPVCLGAAGIIESVLKGKARATVRNTSTELQRQLSTLRVLGEVLAYTGILAAVIGYTGVFFHLIPATGILFLILSVVMATIPLWSIHHIRRMRPSLPETACDSGEK